MDVHVIFLVVFVPVLCTGFKLQEGAREIAEPEQRGTNIEVEGEQASHLCCCGFESTKDLNAGELAVYLLKTGCQFSVDPNHALYGHNDEIWPDQSLEQCLEKCAEYEHCLSVDYNVKNRRCITSYSSRDTYPNKYGTHKRVDYYHKVTCGDKLAEDESIIDGECIKHYDPVGGVGGDAFSDKELYAVNKGNISSIRINHGSSIDCIGITYGTGDQAQKGPCHGGWGGNKKIITMQSNEYVTGIQATVGEVIDGLTICTNLATYGPYGKEYGDDFAVDSEGRRLAYISGRAGGLLDQLSLHFHC